MKNKQRGDAFIVVMCLLLAAYFLVLGYAIYLTGRNSTECKNRGGRMVHDGTFTMVWQVTDYKTGMGFFNYVPHFVCSVAKED